MKRINANPALKNAYETLVKPARRPKRSVIAQIARTARRAVARTQGQQQQRPEGVASESALRLPRSQPNTEACRSSSFRGFFWYVPLQNPWQ